jgi:hypothetical protein
MDNLQREIKIRLRKILDELNKDIKTVSKDMKYTESKVKGLRSGNQFITPEIALDFENLYFINASWLIFGRGEKLIPKFNIGQFDEKLKLTNQEILEKLKARDVFLDEIKKENELIKNSLGL